MFEKEAEEYAKQNNPAEYGVRATHFTVLNSFKDGAEFGYNKVKAGIAVLKKDKQRLTKAVSIIRNLLRVTYGDGWNYSLDAKVEAEQFLKVTTDIREASTLDGDWVVDEH